MLYFTKRSEARSFSSKKGSYKVVDNGVNSTSGNRWGVKVI